MRKKRRFVMFALGRMLATSNHLTIENLEAKLEGVSRSELEEMLAELCQRQFIHIHNGVVLLMS